MGSIEHALDIDLGAEITRISEFIRQSLSRELRRRGVVIAVSGGIDSSVCAGLCVRALGAERVLALMLPERESSARSLELGQQLVHHLGVRHVVQDITAALDALGCYAERDAAIASVVPEYGAGYKQKIAIQGGADGRFNHFVLVTESPAGNQQRQRLGLAEYLRIVAATNYKQRIRKSIEYFHADRLNYAVVGTPNRLEYDQGFFVKNGDGSADLKPIAHLYKSQVYALARELDLPAAICETVPTTDTYTLSQGQDEFFFALPYQRMDVALWAHDQGISPSELAAHLALSAERTEHVYRDIEAKRRVAAYLHLRPLVLEV